jgi:hypothetical protein
VIGSDLGKMIFGKEGFYIGGTLDICKTLIIYFPVNYRIATVSLFTYDISIPDVKSLNQMYIL